MHTDEHSHVHVPMNTCTEDPPAAELKDQR